MSEKATGRLRKWLLPLLPIITVALATIAVSFYVVRVPELRGKSVEDAKRWLPTVGLSAKVVREEFSKAKPGAIISQKPSSSSLALKGSGVEIVVSKGPKTVKDKTSSSGRSIPNDKIKPFTSWRVCIDPGHQSRADLAGEPIGPGASETKPRVAGGATGASTGVPEYEFVLKLSKRIADELKKQGLTVILTRESNDVDLSNAERAEMANKEKADLFVRIHADSSNDQSVHGATTLYPEKNGWTGPIYEPSKRAAETVQKSIVAGTGAADRGIAPRGDLSGFNWAKVSSILIEAGFLSNPDEDRRLNSDAYQDKLAKSIANGVVKYLKER